MNLLTTLILTGSLLIASAETPSCNCASKPTSRAALLQGEHTTFNFSVQGMSCEGCEKGLSTKLKAIKDLQIQEVSHKEERVIVHAPTGQYNAEQLVKYIEKAGYSVSGETITLQAVGMSCGGCEKGLTKKAANVKGVVSVEKACHQTNSLTLTVEPGTCKTTLVKTLNKTGYQISL